jgi:hypothetical protein
MGDWRGRGMETPLESSAEAPVDLDAAKRKVLAPAIGIMVVGILGGLFSLFASVMALINPQSLNTGVAGADKVAEQVGTVLGVIMVFAWAAMGLFAAFGGFRMMGLKSYGLSFTACIFSMVPCYNSCCILGLPFGIWGLIVLLQPDVKEAFKMVSEMRDPGQF